LNKEEIRVAVVGAGEHGRNHARQYRSVEGAELVGIYDVQEERRRQAAEEFGITAFGSLDQVWEAAQAASIVIPTTDHAAVARQALEGGVDILLEKPITHTLEEADEIVQLAAAKRRVLQVGHVERFNPGVVAAKSVTHNPLFFEIHRLGVFSSRSLDVDVVFDLMIHDLDLVLWMTQSRVRDVRAVGLPVLSDKVDIANARVEFESGAVANFTASRVSTEKVRKFRYFQPHEYVSIDFTRRDVLVVSVQQTDDSPQIGFRKLPTEPAEPLRAELEAFLESVRSRKPPLVDGVEGRKALALATEVMSQIQEHAEHINVHLIQPPGHSGES
jgi:predicted dehydrogenase